MKPTSRPPKSGFRLDAVHFYKQSQSPPPRGKVTARKRPIRVSWDWRRVAKSQVQVKLSVEIGPSLAAPETLAVSLFGDFSYRGKTALPVERFVGVNAVSILVPYAREALSNLSSRGLHGTYYLPSINVVELMKVFNFSRTTGARQALGATKGGG
jgi:preprotein translocase subunit SecB